MFFYQIFPNIGFTCLKMVVYFAKPPYRQLLPQLLKPKGTQYFTRTFLSDLYFAPTFFRSCILPELNFFFGRNTNFLIMTSGKIQNFEHPLRAKYNFFRQKFGQKSDLFFGQNTNFLELIRDDFGQNTNFVQQEQTKLTFDFELSADKNYSSYQLLLSCYSGHQS